MKEPRISASMMCADLANLREIIRILERYNVGYLHVDVMDGSFVPNFGLGTDYIRELRKLTDIPLDIHMMVVSPEYKLHWIGLKPGDTVSIHYESTAHIQRVLDQLTDIGCHKFIAINPATPVYALEEVLDSIDGVNLLMVNPGFAGQKIVPGAIRKAEKLVSFLRQNDKEDIRVEVDGNISLENAGILRAIGADTFVAGSSSIFRGTFREYERNIAELSEIITEGNHTNDQKNAGKGKTLAGIS